VTLADEELARCYRLVMALADSKKDVDDADLLRLAREAQSGRDAADAPVTSGVVPGGRA
jgi:hypothetical protein